MTYRLLLASAALLSGCFAPPRPDERATVKYPEAWPTAIAACDIDGTYQYRGEAVPPSALSAPPVTTPLFVTTNAPADITSVSLQYSARTGRLSLMHGSETVAVPVTCKDGSLLVREEKSYGVEGYRHATLKMSTLSTNKAGDLVIHSVEADSYCAFCFPGLSNTDRREHWFRFIRAK